MDASDPLSNDSTPPTYRYLRIHAPTITSLPAPDEGPWLFADVDIDHGTLLHMSDANVIEAVDTLYRSSPVDDRWGIHRWRTLPEPYDIACNYATTIATLPCCGVGTGISTHAAPEGSYFGERWYECKVCGCAHTREIAAEVLR